MLKYSAYTLMDGDGVAPCRKSLLNQRAIKLFNLCSERNQNDR